MLGTGMLKSSIKPIPVLRQMTAYERFYGKMLSTGILKST